MDVPTAGGLSAGPAAATAAVFATLRTRRKELRLTQRELADLAGVSVRFIHDLENGKPTVQLDRVLAVANTLGLELEWQLRRPPTDGLESDR